MDAHLFGLGCGLSIRAISRTFQGRGSISLLELGEDLIDPEYVFSEHLEAFRRGNSEKSACKATISATHLMVAIYACPYKASRMA